ncbi:hypothetical protein [Polaribacter uvawellassae]|uniref:hypothetical protein n=1 Tax=Polaribacter uvawellassae TaxID=3133495 RepID=UPI0032195C51
MSENIRFIIAALAGVLIIVHFFRINFKNLSWKENGSSYLGIISMILIIIAMLLSK